MRLRWWRLRLRRPLGSQLSLIGLESLNDGTLNRVPSYFSISTVTGAAVQAIAKDFGEPQYCY